MCNRYQVFLGFVVSYFFQGQCVKSSGRTKVIAKGATTLTVPYQLNHTMDTDSVAYSPSQLYCIYQLSFVLLYFYFD